MILLFLRLGKTSYFKRFSFTSTELVTQWMNTIACPTSNNSCGLCHSSSLYSGNDYAYASPCYDNKIFLLKFNQTGGTTLDTQYISDQS